MRIREIALAGAIAAGLGAAAVPASGAPDIATEAAGVTAPGTAGDLSRAGEMLREGNYAGAIDRLENLLTRSGAALGASEREECAYMLARAKYERGDADCLRLLDNFCSTWPASFHTPEARLLAADCLYFNGEFGEAAERYATAGLDRLDPKTRSLYRLRYGVSLVKSGKFQEGADVFNILQRDEAYRDRARFYLAYIDYALGNYDAAYEEFGRLESRLPQGRATTQGRRSGRTSYEPTGYEARYYMTQIDFLRGDWEKAATEGRTLLERMPVKEFEAETDRIVGESLYKLNRYGEAKSYLETYLADRRAEGDIAEPTAVYALGAIDYSEGDYEAARALFERIAGEQNDIGQGASLYLGQCAAREGDDSAAAMLFERAATMAYDLEVAETAYYNYVAARTHGGRIPFSSAITLFEGFLREYPRSRYAGSVRQELATAYYHEKDYARAMQSIEAVSNPTERVLEAKQKIAYEYGVELLANDEPSQAEKYLRMASQMRRQDAKTARAAEIWLGDALYAQRKYGQATEAYTRYLDGAGRDSNRTLALYDLGYSLYMQKRYGDAAKRFRQAINTEPALPGALRTDATIRLADCLYYSGDTRQAIDSYTAAIEAGATDGDYALLRRGMMHGISGDQKAKIADLREVVRSYPQSRWVPQAMLETGLALSETGQIQQAARELNSLADRYPQSPEARKGLLNLAIIHSGRGDSKNAIETYKEVIRRWPSSEEAAMAGTDLRTIYASAGNLPELAAFLRTVPGAPQLDTDEIERLAYDAAARAYSAEGKTPRKLEEYVKTYPDGRYVAAALADIAEWRLEKGDREGALEAAERLLRERPDAAEAPAALLVKARVLESRGGKERAKALETWRELGRRGGSDYAGDAYAGIMRTTGSAAEMLEYARKVQAAGGGSAGAADEGRLYEALALGRLDRHNEAEVILRRLATNPATAAGAQAAVELGQSLLDRRKLKDAEKVLTTFTDTGSPHQYWLARGFITLADVYRAQGRTSLAREYLVSLRDNYPGDESDISEMISSRLKNWKK